MDSASSLATGVVKGSINMTRTAVNTSVTMTSKAVTTTGSMTGKAVMGTVNMTLDTTLKAGALTRDAAGNLKNFSSRYFFQKLAFVRFSRCARALLHLS